MLFCNIITCCNIIHRLYSEHYRNENNYNVLYYTYEGLKSDKKLAEYGLDKLSGMRYLPQRATKNPTEMSAGYKTVNEALRVLAFNEEVRYIFIFYYINI